MIVRCPQCQNANQVEVEAAKPRIICARCATVISVEFLSNYNLSPVTDVVSERKETKQHLNMQTPENSPLDLDSLLDTTAPALVTPVVVTPVVTPVPKAPEQRWDNDEILDIPSPKVAPIVTPTVTVSSEAPLSVEELVTPVPPVVEATIVPVAAEVVAEPINVAPEASGYLSNMNPFPAAPEAVHNVTNHVTSFMGDTTDRLTNMVTGNDEPTGEASPEQPSVFAQDSYSFRQNTYVVATPDKNNKSRLVRIFLTVGLLCAVLAVGWWALSGLVKDWLGLRKPEQAVVVPPPPVKPNVGPSVVPSLGAKVGTDKNPNAAASASVAVSAAPAASVAADARTSPGAAASVKASPVEASKPTPAAAANQKPTPAPPAQTGSSGHATGAGDGSLTVQFAAYKSPTEAQSTAARLKSAGIESRVVKAEVPGKGTWYRVQAGRFTTEAEASKYASELRAKGAARDFIVTGYQAQ